MQEHEAVRAYVARINELHEDVRAALLSLLNVLLSSAAVEARKQRCKMTVRNLAALDAMLPKDHKPGWLSQLIDSINKYEGTGGDEESATSLRVAILDNHRAIFGGKLLGEIEVQVPPVVDFDVIYRETFDSSQLPKLFDQLTGLIETIIKSGAVDSVKAINTLERLVLILKQNRNGSYQSAKGAFHVAVALTKNMLAEYIDDSSVGPMVRAVNKTLEELGTSFAEVTNETFRKLQAILPFNLKGIGQQPIDRIAYGGEVIEGQATPAADHPKIANTPDDAAQPPAA